MSPDETTRASVTPDGEWDDEFTQPRTGIRLACGHVWWGDGTPAEAREFAALCVATGDTATCGTCGTQQAVTTEIVEDDETGEEARWSLGDRVSPAHPRSAPLVGTVTGFDSGLVVVTWDGRAVGDLYKPHELVRATGV